MILQEGGEKMQNVWRNLEHCELQKVNGGMTKGREKLIQWLMNILWG